MTEEMRIVDSSTIKAR